MWLRESFGGGGGQQQHPALGAAPWRGLQGMQPSPSAAAAAVAAAAAELADFSGRADCVKLLKELNRELSTYHSLAQALGGSTDCEQMRDEMKRNRRRAQQLVKQIQGRLQPCLNDPKLSEREKDEAQRLWHVYICCLSVLESELRRTLALQRLFALHAAAPSCLIKTGLSSSGTGSGHSSSQRRQQKEQQHSSGGKNKDAVLDVPLDDRLALDNAELGQLHKELAELRGTVNELQATLEMRDWGQVQQQGDGFAPGQQQQQQQEKDGQEEEHQLLPIVNDQQQTSVAAADALSMAVAGDSDAESAYSDLDSVAEEDDDAGMTPQQRRCLCWIVAVMVAIFFLAAALGICIAFLS